MHFGKIRIASFIFLNILLASPLNVYCQSQQANSSYHELVYVHLEKLIYVAGEQIRYRAFVVNPLATDHRSCSKILYFTLTSNKDKNQVCWRINLDDKPEMCYFTLPENMQPGMYILNAYTNLMRNNSANSFYAQNVLVLSLSEAIPDSIMVNSRMDSIAESISTRENYGKDINIKPSKAIYFTREKAKIRLSLSSGSIADITVSVAIQNPLGKYINRKNILSCFEKDSQGSIKDTYNSVADHFNPLRFKYGSEDHSFILSGNIKSRNDNSPLVAGKILLSVIDSIAPRIKYSRTDSSGSFLFYLDRFYDNKKIFIQFADQNIYSNYYWTLDSKTPDPVQFASSLYVLKTEEKAFLNEERNLRLIDAVYNSNMSKTNSEELTGGSNYFSPPTMIVAPSEYFDLVNFREIAENILPMVKFGMRSGNYFVQILNLRTGLWKENNTVLLNGVPFSDLAYIATLGTKDIKRIEIIGSGFLIGELTFPGFISIYTYDNRIPDNYIKNNTLTFKNTVISNRIDEGSAESAINIKNTANYPDFRNSLYWNPGIKVKANENLNLEFTVSGLTGKYVIYVEGLNQDGHPVSSASFFEVKEK